MGENIYSYKYPHPAVTADCVIFGMDGTEIKVLLIQRGIDPYKGSWAFPGGFMNIDETAEECARRELEEETGLKDVEVEQFHTFTAVDRDPRERVITVAHYAVVPMSYVKGGDDAAAARWFSLNEIPDLAFDHDKILKMALKCLEKRIGRKINIGNMRKYTPEAITSLKPNEIFVFGSNLEGSHGGGAARYAYEKFGAIWGQGVGLQGQSYGIPTMHGGVEAIRPYVDEFITFARTHPELVFYVTKIGCGIAGFRISEIAPLFAEACDVDNIILPREFVEECGKIL